MPGESGKRPEFQMNSFQYKFILVENIEDSEQQKALNSLYGDSKTAGLSLET
jgi:hypothetical protein